MELLWARPPQSEGLPNRAETNFLDRPICGKLPGILFHNFRGFARDSSWRSFLGIFPQSKVTGKIQWQNTRKIAGSKQQSNKRVFRVVADVWEKDVWEFQVKSGSSGSCRLFLHFLGKIAVQKTSGKMPGSPDILLPDIRGLLSVPQNKALEFCLRLQTGLQGLV